VPALLELRGVSVHHGALPVLRDVDLTLAPGEIVGVVGPNGSGKSTLLDVVCGLQRPAAGQVLLRGVPLTGREPWDIARRGVARTFQIPKPFGALTVAHNVTVGLTFGAPAPRRDAAALRREADAVLARVGLAERAGVPARVLSLGDRKRLELALALSTRPTILLLDELAAGLSPRGRREVMRFYRRLCRSGLTIVAVEHAVAALAEVADRLVLLNGGAIVAQGAPAEVLRSPEVSAAYLGGADP
jgi:ABC-type branched-subunit amino acid transport system ATPase component